MLNKHKQIGVTENVYDGKQILEVIVSMMFKSSFTISLIFLEDKLILRLL